MITGLPFLCGLSRAFRCNCKVEFVNTSHFLDQAPDHCARVLPVDWNASKLPQKPAERAYEDFLLDHDVGLVTVELCIVKVGDHEVPE